MTEPTDLYRRLSKIQDVIKQRELAEESENDLMAFMRNWWHVVDPEEPFVAGWALEAIVDHLMAVSNGQIKRLLINVPPGFSKSLATDVFWPAWEWGPFGKPWLRYIAAAYSSALTERDNLRFLRVMQDPVYQSIWGHKFTMDLTGVTRISNSRTGWKLATSVGGLGTGERGNRVIIDDPNNPKEVESSLVRDAANLWVREVMPDRLNNLREGAIVCIQQRTHQHDVSGTLLEFGTNYTHLMIPMEYDPRRHCVTVLKRTETGEPELVWADPRGLNEDGAPLDGTDDDGNPIPGSPLALAEGETAWPERFPRDVIEEQKSMKGPYAYAGQYLQSPVPRGGGIIKREWWIPWINPLYPTFGTVVASLDTAYKESEENDYNALTVWGAFGGPDGKPKIMLVDAWRDRLSLPSLVKKVGELCRKHRIDYLLIEDKSRGSDVAAEITRLFGTAEWQTLLLIPVGDKVSRANSCVPMWAGTPTRDPATGMEVWPGGVIYAPVKDWAEKVIEECEAMPKGAHDDLADSATQAVAWMRKNGVAIRREEHDEYELEAMRYHKPTPLPYDV